jgi:glycerol transport system permease protein
VTSPCTRPTSPFKNYIKIFTDPTWYTAYINAIIYVSMNTVMSLAFALPAAYAFSRYKIHRRRADVFLAADQPHGPSGGLSAALSAAVFDHQPDGHPYRRGAGPLPVQRAPGHLDPGRLHVRVPKEIDETAFIDGYSFPRFFLTIFIPLIRAGVGVTAFFCFMFSWVELLFARTLTITEAKPIVATMTRTISATGLDWGLLAAAGVLTIVPGGLVIWFVRNHLAKGFALGRV